MSYIGNQSQTAYSSLVKQDITGNGGSTYTLSHPVSSENDILLYINNVKQEGGVGKAFTATGTTLTLSENISSSDSCYVQYIGLAIQTVVPPDGSVTSAKLDTNIAVSGNLTVNGAFTSQGIDDNADATAVTIDSSERIMIGTTTEGEANADNFTVSGSGNVGMTIRSTSSNEANIYFSDGTSGDDEYRGFISYNHSDNSLRLGSNASERMRINSNGHLMLNTSTARTGTNSITLEGGNSFFMFRATGTGSLQQASFFRNTDATPSQVGSIFTSSVGTSYNQTSDYRLKENVNYSFDATTRLKKLKPARFNFIIDADTTVDGFLAHEVQSVVPEAITGEKDAVDADGNIDPQGIDQSKIVPLLTKALQEQQATIEALEARITALENS